VHVQIKAQLDYLRIVHILSNCTMNNQRNIECGNLHPKLQQVVIYMALVNTLIIHKRAQLLTFKIM
jgi:hypothetical protein